MLIRVFKAADKFILDGRGIAIAGGPYPETEGRTIVPGTEFELRSGDRVVLRSRIVDFELMRNCWSPHMPRAMVILVAESDFELPEDADIWVEESGIKNREFV